MTSFVICILTLASMVTHAQFLPAGADFGRSSIADSEVGKFISPNEWHVEALQPILDQAAQGAVISVGTEVAMMVAAIHPRATHLIMVDYDVETVRYNRINIALLAVAKTRDQYVALRRSNSQREWLRALFESKIYPQHKQLLSQPENFYLWRQRQAQSTEDMSTRFTYDFDVLDVPEYFGQANYLRHDLAFERLHTLAVGLKMDAVLLDLSNAKAPQILATELRKLGVHVSAFNVSNAASAFYKFGNGAAVKNLIEALKPVSNDDTLMINSKEYVVPHWIYAAFSFGYLRQQSDPTKSIAAQFAKTISEVDKELAENEARTGYGRYDEPHFGQIVERFQSRIFRIVAPASPVNCEKRLTGN